MLAAAKSTKISLSLAKDPKTTAADERGPFREQTVAARVFLHFSDLPWIFTSAALPHEVVGGLGQGGSLKVAVCVVQEGFAQLCLLLLQLAGRRVQLLLRFLNDTCKSGDHRNPATVT